MCMCTKMPLTLQQISQKTHRKKRVEENASVSFFTTKCVYWFIAITYC